MIDSKHFQIRHYNLIDCLSKIIFTFGSVGQNININLRPAIADLLILYHHQYFSRISFQIQIGWSKYKLKYNEGKLYGFVNKLLI